MKKLETIAIISKIAFWCLGGLAFVASITATIWGCAWTTKICNTK